MGTSVDIVKVIKNPQGEIQYPVDEEFEYLTLSRDFTNEILTATEGLSKFLSSEEIDLIQPNWGRAELKSTDTFSPVKREEYLELLREVIRTNSDKRLNQFLVNEGIISFELKDLKRDPQAVLHIIERIENKIESAEIKEVILDEFQEEFKRLKDFLIKRINSDEYILIEY